jgi:hypothetical protein
MKAKYFKRGLMTAMALTGFLLMTGSNSSVDAATVTQTPSSETGTISTYGHGNGNLWENYMIIRKDGKAVFCVDPTTAVIDGGYTSEAINDAVYIDGDSWNGSISTEQIRKMELIAYYGYYSNPTDARYTYTQALIWEVIGFYPKNFDGTLSMEDYNSFKAEVEAKVNGYKNTTSWDGDKVELKVGESKTLVDLNNVIQNLDTSPHMGYNFSVNGNELTITATENAEDGLLVFTQGSNLEYVGTSLIWRKPGSQTLAELFIQDPQHGAVEVTTVKTKGDFGFQKVDFEGNPISGVEFDLYSVAADKTVTKVGTYTTDDSGNLEFRSLEQGNYYIVESKAKEGYTLDTAKYEFTVVAGNKITSENKKVLTNLKEPEIETLAQNYLKETKEVYEFETIKETAYLKNTDKGRVYKVRTYMNDYDTREERLSVQEREVVGTGGDMQIEFEYPVLKKTFGHRIVFGEEVLDEKGNVIKSHFDWENDKETVYVRMPKIKTTAQVNGQKVVTVGKDGKVTDTIAYEGFKTEGEEVFVRLEVAKYGTEEVVGTYETTAKVNEKGELVITADNINTKDLPAGKYVLFETIFELKDGKPTKNIISQERNPKNEDQSFVVESPDQPTLPNTGTQESGIAVIGGIIALIGALGVARKKEVQ